MRFEYSQNLDGLMMRPIDNPVIAYDKFPQLAIRYFWQHAQHPVRMGLRYFRIIFCNKFFDLKQPLKCASCPNNIRNSVILSIFSQLFENFRHRHDVTRLGISQTHCHVFKKCFFLHSTSYSTGDSNTLGQAIDFLCSIRQPHSA